MPLSIVQPLILRITIPALLLMIAVLNGQTTVPDFTKGAKIPAKEKHDWNLGATGARGWIFCDNLVTADARQIAVTRVEKDSPADGILAVGDVLLEQAQTAGLSGVAALVVERRRQVRPAHRLCRQAPPPAHAHAAGQRAGDHRRDGYPV